MGEKRNGVTHVLWRGGTGDAAVVRNRLVRVACTATWSQVMSGPLLLPRWLHGSQGAVLMSVVPITTKGHEGCLWSGLPPKAMLMFKGHAELALPLREFALPSQESWACPSLTAACREADPAPRLSEDSQRMPGLINSTTTQAHPNVSPICDYWSS